jgi:hypothetical protein
MSFLGTLEGIGAGDPMGSFLKSNVAAIDQVANQAAGKALISMFSGQVPGAQSLGGPPVSSGMPPSIQPPTVPPMPIAPQPFAGGGQGGTQVAAGGGPPQSMVPGAQAMPPTPTLPGAPQGVQGSGPPAGPNNPPPGFTTPMGGSQPNPELVARMQQRALLQAKLQQLQGQQGGGGMPQAPQPGPQASQRPQSGPVQGPQMQQQPLQQAQIPPQLQQLAQGVQQSQGRLTWQHLVQSVVDANPGASAQVVAGAVQKLIPLMNASSLQDWRDIQGRLRQEQVGENIIHHEVMEPIAQQNADTRRLGQEDTAVHRREMEQQGRDKIGIAKSREGRLTVQGEIRNDQRFKEFEFKKEQAEKKFQRAKTQDERTQANREWMAALNEQKTYMNTIVNADKMFDENKRKQLLKDNEEWHKQQRWDMQRKQEGSLSNRFQPAENMPPAISQGQ